MRTILAANPGIASFNIGRLDTEAGVFGTDVDMKVRRYAVGAKGSFFENWNWDVYAQTGRNHYDRLDINNRITANFLQAVDAVVHPTTGQIVCRSSIANPNNGCVPANVFGQGSISQAAVAYYSGTSWLVQQQQQDVYAFKIDGRPFDLWAGPLRGIRWRVSQGGDHRRLGPDLEGERLAPDQHAAAERRLQREGRLPRSRRAAREGDVTAVRLLDLNAAVRSTDYSTSGSVTTWKGGFNYEPIEDLRFRGTVSRDIRAPNINELYSGQSQQIPSIIDPFRGVQRNANVLTGGNPNLVPGACAELHGRHDLPAALCRGAEGGDRLLLDRPQGRDSPR